MPSESPIEPDDHDADAPAHDDRPPSELDLDVLRASLESPERIQQVAPAVGCVLVLTDRRFVVVRDGARFRPANGVRSWPLDRNLDVRVAATRETTSRLQMTGTGIPSTSVFVRKAHLKAVAALIADVRARTYEGER